ncbi:hypothetical protein MHM93_14330 [Pseudoalteromonas sp. MM17-2]|uniref:hypothetical protein n=1 Tax=Pseudoalteromonas sp. MM17-2 TaxID=2917753 RepID=UPI001EF4A162|nr:hypothetical protein [Pseudoalteromonas sp. MM17-2]MCG7545354.1 hypothetical protein [Pseudoalteromonas sp. MM17-2]
MKTLKLAALAMTCLSVSAMAATPAVEKETDVSCFAESSAQRGGGMLPPDLDVKRGGGMLPPDGKKKEN